MDEIGKSIEKLVKAGLGAVSEGLNLTQDVVDKLAEKGEPIFDQARSSMNETAEKLRNAVKNNAELKRSAEEIKHSLLRLEKAQLLEIRNFIDSLIESAGGETDGNCCTSDETFEEETETECDAFRSIDELKANEEDISPLEEDIPEFGPGPDRKQDD